LPTDVPPILAVPAVAAVPAVLEAIIYGGFRNMIENYSVDNLKIPVINASVTWGGDSFTVQIPQTIKEMTIANSLAMTPTNLKPAKLGEVLQLTRMHSKFMAHQLITWCTPDGKEEEMDGLTILANVLNRIRPHYKVDMYLGIDKLKKETLEQHENNIDLYFDSVHYHKLQIDQKNPHVHPRVWGCYQTPPLCADLVSHPGRWRSLA
jgi:hypothetical protein